MRMNPFSDGLVMIGQVIMLIYSYIALFVLFLLLIAAICVALGGGGSSSSSSYSSSSSRDCFFFSFPSYSGGGYGSSSSYSSSWSEFNYMVMALAPLTGTLAILLALYLGMPLLALILGLIPATALGFILLGFMIEGGCRLVTWAWESIKKWDEEQTQQMAAQQRLQEEQPGLSLSNDKQWAMGISLTLVLTIVTCMLLYNFALMPLYAWYIGIAATGLLITMGLGYLSTFLYEKIKTYDERRGEAAQPFSKLEHLNGHVPANQSLPSQLIRQDGYRPIAPSAPPNQDIEFEGTNDFGDEPGAAVRQEY